MSDAFATWAAKAKPSVLNDEIDRSAVEYLDHLFFEGCGVAGGQVGWGCTGF